MATATCFTCLLLISSAFLAFCRSVIQEQSRPPIMNGLSWTFYQNTCPQLETIIRRKLNQVFTWDIGQAAGLLRLQFHDCSYNCLEFGSTYMNKTGCDGSILLERASDRTEIPNLTLRSESFQILKNLRQIVHGHCGRVVSCSDILTIAAHGVTFAPVNQTLVDLVSPTANVSTILSRFARKNLNVTDAVALSGADTIGISTCSSFTNCLYPTQDPTMDPAFTASLIQICPELNSTGVTVLDARCQNMGYVTRFFTNQTFFFRMFMDSMVKMGQLDVLTGTQGAIRANCSRRNSDNQHLLFVVKENFGSSSTMR
ncbi:hypothetical protein P3X46_028381 [Hevea brasiliensis]|uniref:Peroxidase n=1 Tax=Hevea brasiliensis TaxID=3981 RepID=A0ABQ9KNT2_HEVBR|nr:hypothetical protein P3X46_028381 [Hevea brasiliensis]